MATVIRLDAFRLQRTNADDPSIAPGLHGRSVLQTSGCVNELFVFSQVHPAMGWVIVACRNSKPYAQIPGVYASHSAAEAQMLRLAQTGMAQPGSFPRGGEDEKYAAAYS